MLGTVDHEFKHFEDNVRESNLQNSEAANEFERLKIKQELSNFLIQDLKLKDKNIINTLPSEYAKTDVSEFLAETFANSKSTIYAKIKKKFGFNMRELKHFKELEKLALSKDNTEDVEIAKHFYDKLISSKYCWGLAYRILETKNGIRLSKV